MSLTTYNIENNKKLYITTLSIIFFLISAILVLIDITLKTQGGDANIINISGRQRMLSQNITKEILIAANEEYDSLNHLKLQNLMSQFDFSHESLVNGNDSLNLPTEHSDEIKNLFILIEPEFIALKKAANLVIANPHDKEAIQTAKIIAIQHEETFLRIMNTIVNNFEKEAKSKLKFIERLEIVLGITALLVVISVYFFILNPLHNKTVLVRYELEDTNRNLNESLIQLEELAQSLSEEVEERKATEDKLIKNQAELTDTNNKLNTSYQDLRNLTLDLEEEIVERKNTESQLKSHQEELEKLALIANKTDNAVIICNAEGKIEWVNASFERITEYTINEVIGQKPGDFLQGEETDQNTVKLMGEKIKKGIGFNTDIVNYSKSGRKYWIRVEVQPIRNMEGKVIKFIAIESDITQSKNYEQALKLEKEKAEKAAMAKQEFLSTVSHEIRTPMNAIIGLTHILLSNEPKPLQVENLNALKFSADTLLALINDILDLSKIEAGKTDFEKTDFSIREIINSIEKSLSVLTKDKDVNISSHIDKDIPEIINGDQIRLNQIITNLVNNAIKFTESGTIKINIEKSAFTEDNITLKFAVKDTGIGIPKNRLSKIFERFTQANQNTTRLYGGTGLGLTITKQLIELQGGKIWVESKEGLGSTFFFEITFDKRKYTKEENLKSERNEINIRGLHVLLVEDNKMNQMVAEQFMSNWDIEMTAVESGEEALEIIKNKSFDLVLMDLNMPGIDGFDTSLRIRSMQDSYFNELPIIALTASTIDDVKEKIFEYGMNDFATKPFDPNELFNKLTKHVQIASVQECVS